MFAESILFKADEARLPAELSTPSSEPASPKLYVSPADKPIEEKSKSRPSIAVSPSPSADENTRLSVPLKASEKPVPNSIPSELKSGIEISSPSKADVPRSFPEPQAKPFVPSRDCEKSIPKSVPIEPKFPNTPLRPLITELPRPSPAELADSVLSQIPPKVSFTLSCPIRFISPPVNAFRIAVFAFSS